ncbi:MAG TPA: hypothetical protein VKB21_08565 [Candidatus Acidoferrum sp.]|nr:hypothetical protein [Candidatus Acidoferrum sp.]
MKHPPEATVYPGRKGDGVKPPLPGTRTLECTALAGRGLHVFGVGIGVVFGGLRGVVGGVVKMTLGDQRVMRCGVMITGLMAGSGFAMMARSVLVVFGSFTMMLDGCVRHGGLLTEF